jgi:glycolate oxidase iron-sulfur subunit
MLRLGRMLAPILPAQLQSKIPAGRTGGPMPATEHARKMLVLEGCVQSSATPGTNAAARRVLSNLGISLVTVRKAGCCGAVNYHLAAHSDGLDDMRRNIDAWWPSIEDGAEAIVSTASGCGAMLIDYGTLLAGDPAYAAKAKCISELTRDITEVLMAEDLAKLSVDTGVGKIAVHTPCTLHHALHLADAIPQILGRAGFDLAKPREQHLCCGSAGSYSILQPEISGRLRERKLIALNADAPSIIATGNVGCQLHLGERSNVPEIHWIELFD